MGFEGDPFAFCVFSPLFFCAFLSYKFVKDLVWVDWFTGFYCYDLSFESCVDLGFQKLFGEFFSCVFQLKYGAFYLSKATVDLAV